MLVIVGTQMIFVARQLWKNQMFAQEEIYFFKKRMIMDGWFKMKDFHMKIVR